MTHGITEKGALERWDDPATLLEPVRERVVALDGRMKALGHESLIWECLRSFERAAMNARKGTGIKDSIHCYGGAADLVCRTHMWSCKQHGCDFYETLGEQAEKCGLYWGGRFKKYDGPHVQAVPPTVKAQNELRQAKTHEERKAVVRKYLRPMVP